MEAPGVYDYEIIPNAVRAKRISFKNKEIVLANRTDPKRTDFEASTFQVTRVGASKFYLLKNLYGYLCTHNGMVAVCNDPVTLWEVGDVGNTESAQQLRTEGKCLEAAGTSVTLGSCDNQPLHTFYLTRHGSKEMESKIDTNESFNADQEEAHSDTVPTTLKIPGNEERKDAPDFSGLNDADVKAAVDKGDEDDDFAFYAKRLSYSHAMKDMFDDETIPGIDQNASEGEKEKKDEKKKGEGEEEGEENSSSDHSIIRPPPRIYREDEVLLDPKYKKALQKVHKHCATISNMLRKEAREGRHFPHDRMLDTLYHYYQKNNPDVMEPMSLHGLPRLHEYDANTCYNNPICDYGRQHGPDIYRNHWNHE